MNQKITPNNFQKEKAKIAVLNEGSEASEEKEKAKVIGKDQKPEDTLESD